MRKKKILWHTDYLSAKTGYGRYSKAILPYLYKTNKYDIVEYCPGLYWEDARAKLVPWTCRGTMPNAQNELGFLKMPDGTINEPLKRITEYGGYYIDKVIREEKPDIYVGINDIWAFTDFRGKAYWNLKWWDKINSILQVTLDSLPILPQAIDAASKVKNYYVWAKFAEEAMHKIKHPHVKLLHGAIDSKHFYKLSPLYKRELRLNNNIPEDAFIIGFVFRNQTRKRVHRLMEAFSRLIKNYPEKRLYLLLHTFWEEGWDLEKYIKEYSIPNEKVLTTYICRNCHKYEVKPFVGRDADCKHCGVKANPQFIRLPSNDRRRSGQITTSTAYGVSEQQLNEVYNLMDIYCHVHNSGAQELPIQEAKLTELITAVTNYACGTEYCTEESGGLPIDWSEYREEGSQFIKAEPDVDSMQANIQHVLSMPVEEKEKMGKTARQYILDNCSVQSVGKQWEEIFDAMPLIEWDFDFKEPIKNTKYPFIEDIVDDKEWITDLYKGVLLREPDPEGMEYWMNMLNAIPK